MMMMMMMMMMITHHDSDNEDPTVRGLALRSLCNLRLESLIEYIEQPLLRSLVDISAYVRKTAVMGILKVSGVDDDDDDDDVDDHHVDE